MVDSHFESYDPRGDTPLVAAYSYFLTSTEPNLRIDPPDPNIYNAIVLVSDGMDTCEPCMTGTSCTPDEYERQNAENLGITARALRDYFEIRSYVIGFGDGISALELNAVAFDGGSTITSYVAADDRAGLVAAFDTIARNAAECYDINLND
jgi:hypothetical protein